MNTREGKKVTITLSSIKAGGVSAVDLRNVVLPYGDVDMVDVPEQHARLVTTAIDVLLTPLEGTPATLIHPVLRDELSMIPFRTAYDAALTEVTRNRVMKPAGNGSQMAFLYMTFVYDDGVRVTEWVDHGDHGLTLVLDAQGRPAFYTVLTSDGYFDASITMRRAGLSFDIVDRLEEIPDANLRDLVGAVDPAKLGALPRLGRTGGPLPVPEPEPVKPEGMTLRQLYAPPPSPVGRARLGRR
jgi:hypothetical protein